MEHRCCLRRFSVANTENARTGITWGWWAQFRPVWFHRRILASTSRNGARRLAAGRATFIQTIIHVRLLCRYGAITCQQRIFRTCWRGDKFCWRPTQVRGAWLVFRSWLSGVGLAEGMRRKEKAAYGL